MRAIFISYRREDSEGQAGRLFTDLGRIFGPQSVFMDVAGLKAGRDFRSAIDEQVSSCGVLLAVIGKGWTDVTDSSRTSPSRGPARLRAARNRRRAEARHPGGTGAGARREDAAGRPVAAGHGRPRVSQRARSDARPLGLGRPGVGEPTAPLRGRARIGAVGVRASGGRRGARHQRAERVGVGRHRRGGAARRRLFLPGTVGRLERRQRDGGAGGFAAPRACRAGTCAHSVTRRRARGRGQGTGRRRETRGGRRRGRASRAVAVPTTSRHRMPASWCSPSRRTATRCARRPTGRAVCGVSGTTTSTSAR